jgi:Pathogenicity locus
MSERDLQVLPNVGPAVAAMLVRVGVEKPADLRGRTGTSHDENVPDWWSDLIPI